MFEPMFNQSELELLAEALDFRLKVGGFKNKGGKFETPKHQQLLTILADKVVSFQEAEQDDED